MSGLTLEEVLDDDTVCTVDEAIYELEQHGHDVELCRTEGQQEGYGGIYTLPDEVGHTELIANYVDDEVSTARVMQWLGY